MDEEYMERAYELFPTRESMGCSYNPKILVLARRSRDDCPTTEDAIDKVRRLRERRMIRRDIAFKL